MKKIMKLFIVAIFIVTILPLHSIAVDTSSTSVEQNILNSLLNVETTAFFDPKVINYKEVGDLVEKVINDNPSIFYYKGLTAFSDGKINFQYDGSKQSISEKKKKIDAEVDKVIQATIKQDMSEMEKVKAVHDYLVLSVAYDYENLSENTIPKDSFGVYGSLINKIAVCDGYSKAMQLILNKVGVETLYVAGSVKGENHSWNMVKVDDQYYFVDATWDDPAPNIPGNVNYNYFLVNNEQLKADHQWNEDAYPVAKSEKYNYFHVMNNMIEKDGVYYYSNIKDNLLYKMDQKNLKPSKIISDRAPYFAIDGQWIYYSNYSNGGYLYKVKLDGKGKSQITSTQVDNLYVKDNILYFKENKSNKDLKMVLN